MAHPAVFASLVDLSTEFVLPEAPSSDRELVQLQRTLAEIRRRVDAWAAANAGQIAHRSRREFGYDGLAQRSGARTPELLVQQLSGTSARDAHTMVRVGVLLNESSALDAVAGAVADGRLSLDAADAIRSGLSQVDQVVPPSLISGAAEALVADATVLTVEKLASRARACAAQLDQAHVQDREQALRDRRFLRLTPLRDGMTRVSGLLDPESAAVVIATFDAITSPRRGGPRFVDPTARDYAERITTDSRTTEQLALDSFVELLRIGGDAAPELVGAQRPAVRVIVTDHDLHHRAGHGVLEGQLTPISISSIERQICHRGILPVQFGNDSQPLNLGRTQRLFSSHQKSVLAVRDGGCRFPSCSRPPSWCEAHHITEWGRGGRTDTANGILLCRHHHLLAHNNGWQIIRDGADYFVIPPAALDPFRMPIPAPPQTGLVTRALGAIGA